VDGGFFVRRITAALASRRSLIDFTGTNAFRLVHGEGDGLPGVIVDLYDGYAVLKLYSAGLTAYRPLIVEALEQAVPGLKGVVGRDEVGRDDAEGHDERGNGRMLLGPEAPRPLTIEERGAKFLVDVYAGQKTGFFLDQRENRFLLRRISDGLDVLNCFCFSGG